MTVSYPEDDWVYGFLLSFGDQVEVLSPPGVREELLRRAGAILARYEKHDRQCPVLSGTMEPPTKERMAHNG